MPSTKDLFGDDSSDEDDDDDVPQPEVAAAAEKAAAMDEDSDSSPAAKASATTETNAKTNDNNDDDDDQEMQDDNDEPAPRPPPPPPKVVHQPTLRVPATSRPSDSTTLHVTKLPNLMGLQPQPFDPATFLPAVEEEEFGAAMASTLVRWRYAKEKANDDDNTTATTASRPMESNSRMVEWEDGSWTLHVGTDSFEMAFKDHSKQGFPGFNGFLYQSHQAHVAAPDGEDSNDDPAANATTVLACVAPIRSRVTVHPSSLQSTAHQSLTVAVRQKTLKQARIATLATQDDPELVKQERIRAADDLQKARSKAGERAATGGRRGGGGRQPRMSRDYLEEQDQAYDTTNIRGMKRQAREGDDFDDYGDDDDDDEEDEETFRTAGTRRRAAAAAKKEKEDEEEELVMDNNEEDDDDEEDEGAPLRKKKKATHRKVIDEDDSD
jgi:RNA polymerase-associated protein LEO1